MVSSRVLQLLPLAFLASLLSAGAEDEGHLVIAPQSPVLEIGTNFTATCMIINTAEVTADDLYWNLSKTTIPKEQYIKINRTALNVTIPITSEKPEWLFCLCKRVSAEVVLNNGKFIHGILLVKGYRPKKPENLTCVAVQTGSIISPTITCEWDVVGRQTAEVPITYTLCVGQHCSNETHSTSTLAKTAQVSLDVFPHFMPLDIWVEAHNTFGTIQSDHLIQDANDFVKTDPPSDVTVISEKGFPTTLLIKWAHPIHSAYLKLMYQIRYCQLESQIWNYVPLEDTSEYIQSFRLQNLQADTVYVTQVRCKNSKKNHGFWSNWSHNTTERTQEDRPTSKPDLWKIVAEDGIKIICKDPEHSNGRITRFEIMIQNPKEKAKNGSWEWERILVNRSEADSSSGYTLLKKIPIPQKTFIKVNVTAVNSVGKSDEALLVIPANPNKFAPVKNLTVRPHEGQLLVEWKPPTSTAATEYVVEWVSDNGQIDWQRENGSIRRTVIKGNIERFVCYNVSVYAIYTGRVGNPVHVEVYLEQKAPLKGTDVNLNGNVGRNDAKLVWKEIPQHSRQGFITNYTIFYTDGAEIHAITVPANTTAYTLTSLSANTKYDVWIEASTIGGSKNGSKRSFTTQKYAPGEIEGIVVGVSLGFMFVVLMTMLICFSKKDLIKKNLWPQIPDPGESTIGNWSPDYPLKAETPKENCLSGISVLDMDLCDGRCVIEEDKASLPLKKDKYLSEEHSSGIGGSSCMSSPRQSVSDSDEGGDMADTTSSTIQYSSVVASSGYKGQTPSSHPQQSIFSRSESTQPLLDSEENADMMVQDGSRQFQHFSRQPCCTNNAGNKNTTNCDDFSQLAVEQQEIPSLDFCPLEEDNEQITPTDELSADWLPTGPASSYMPQLGGYRPQ